MDRFKLIKRVSVAVTLVIWIGILVAIYQTKTPFKEQAPKCIFSTMIIFGVLIGIFKWIESLEKENKK